MLNRWPQFRNSCTGERPQDKGPEEFAAQALPLLRRDSGQSFDAEAYKSVLKVGSNEQRALLELQIQQHNVRVASDSRQLR
jgi:hypothetical protein